MASRMMRPPDGTIMTATMRAAAAGADGRLHRNSGARKPVFALPEPPKSCGKCLQGYVAFGQRFPEKLISACATHLRGPAAFRTIGRVGVIGCVSGSADDRRLGS